VLEQRKRFIVGYLEDQYSFTELCEEYGISRKTGYKWVHRFKEEGFDGLKDESRRPKRFRDEVAGEMICEIVKVRQWKPGWGGRSIRSYLLKHRKFKGVPHARTIDRILKRSGFVTSRRHAGKAKSYNEEPIVEAKECNDVWTVDFKGWWRTGDGKRCEPLTIRDGNSRFIVNLAALATTAFEPVKERFIESFELYGLPLYVRSDNGAPFASVRGFCRLTRFAVWLMKLGVTPNRIPPASPHLNGAHERMHRDIKRELQQKPSYNAKLEQKRFDIWRHEFNHVRPHQALGGDPPAKYYRSSRRKYTLLEPVYEYPADFQIRKVSTNGEFNWKNKAVRFAKSLAGEYIGIETCDDGSLQLWFTNYCLATADRYFERPLQPVRKLSRLKT